MKESEEGATVLSDWTVAATCSSGPITERRRREKYPPQSHRSVQLNHGFDADQRAAAGVGAGAADPGLDQQPFRDRHAADDGRHLSDRHARPHSALEVHL